MQKHEGVICDYVRPSVKFALNAWLKEQIQNIVHLTEILSS